MVRGAGAPLSITERQAIRMREALAHRGPDGAGAWSGQGVFLGQRRLEVIAPGHAGHQPMASRDGRWWIVYNGELYNDADLRAELDELGQAPASPCDTATVCQVLSAWGPAGLERCRGMFALVAYDTAERRLVLARDPLGIKPLVFARHQPGDGSGPELVVASEVPAIFAHPRLAPRIDLLGLCGYLSTIRLSVEGRTLFEGVEMLPAGQVREIDLREASMPCRTWNLPMLAGQGDGSPGGVERACEESQGCGGGPGAVVQAIERSVHLHLRSDVPVCLLLSGGLDSAIIAWLTRRERAGLPTFTAGQSSDEGQGCDGAAPGPLRDDPWYAQRLAEAWGLPNRTIRMTQARFVGGVRTLIERTGQPVSTPNETAIHALGCAIRAAGCTVVLTGEGADELFGGYHGPLLRAWQHLQEGGQDPAVDFLLAHAWVPPAGLPMVLNPAIGRSVDAAGWLAEAYRSAYAEEMARPGPAADDVESHMRGHLRLVRRINLAGLLQRVDSALSQSGVEGRTPMADRVVAALADGLPMRERFDPSRPAHEGTKIALRRAFGEHLPEWVVRRPKASFPLPFQGWLAPLVAEVDRDPIVGELFDRKAWSLVASDPASNWHLAWPMVNAAMWARRWFASGHRGA